MTLLSAVALILWIGVLLAPWRPWSTRERLEADRDAPPADLSGVVALIPARNEAARIAHTIQALRNQGPNLRIVVVDDDSDDGTAAAVERLGFADVSLVRGAPLPAGWTGKLWAQSQAGPLLDRPLVLLLDADILLKPGLLAALLAKRRRENAALVSLMAELPFRSAWERLLLPAFVYFFKLLYPFARVNARDSRIAGAAGGCMLVETRALEDIGGFAALKDAVIDDCTLARRIKQRGHRIWIGLTRSAICARRYSRLVDIWRMVARTAYTQLRYSPALLGLCTLVMAVAFLVPVAGVLSGEVTPAALSAAALVVMAAGYLPTLRFYDLGAGLSSSLPLAGALFLAMTWSSALRYLAGERSAWRGRAYPVRAP